MQRFGAMGMRAPTPRLACVSLVAGVIATALLTAPPAVCTDAE